jgi:hypothetical protein
VYVRRLAGSGVGMPRTDRSIAMRGAQFKQLSMLLEPKERRKLAEQFQVKFDEDDAAEEAPPAALCADSEDQNGGAGLSSTDGLHQHAHWRSRPSGSVVSMAAAVSSVEEGRVDQHQHLADFFQPAQPQLREIIADVSVPPPAVENGCLTPCVALS